MDSLKTTIKKLQAEGDKRSYYELATDLELERWSARMKHPLEYAKAKSTETKISDRSLYRNNKFQGMPKIQTNIPQRTQTLPVLQSKET